MTKKTFKRLLPISVVMVLGLVACGKNKNPKADYTYHDCTSANPETWNPATWETSSDSAVMGYIETPLIDFVLNEEGNGYKVVPEMAKKLPTDASATLTEADIAKYGLPEGADSMDGIRWKVELRNDLKWEDGTKITADDFVWSMKALLDSKMQNHRAPDFAGGSTGIANGEAFLYSGTDVLQLFETEDGAQNSGTESTEKTGWYFNPYVTNAWWAGYSWAALTDYLDSDEMTEAEVNAVVAVLKDEANFGTDSSPKYARIDNNETLANTVYAACAAVGKYVFGASVDAGFGYKFDEEAGQLVGDEGNEPFVSWLSKYYTFDICPEENLGITKIDDYSFYYTFSQPVSEFNAKLFFSGNWLIKKDLWEKNRKAVADSGLYASTYGTSVDTTCSYGPYKLTYFLADQSYHFERNNNWYGYKDGNHEGEYQIDAIDVKIIDNEETVKQMFLAGELDGYALRSQDLEDLGASSRLLSTPQSYTTKLTINSNLDALKDLQANDKAGNHTILANLNFRKALSLGLDRKTLCQTQTAGWRGFDMPINFMYVSDPETGVAYRETEQGKKAVIDNFGKDADGEPNYLGYDAVEAKALIAKACEEENAKFIAGDTTAWHTGEKVHLVWEYYNSGWEDMINWVVNAYKELFKGTPLEGLVTIETSMTGAAYSDNIRAGSCDFGISTYGGAQFDPFGIMECYTQTRYMYEPYNIFADGIAIDTTTGDWVAANGLASKEGLDYQTTTWEKHTMGSADGSTSGKDSGWTYLLTSGKYSEAYAESSAVRLNILSAMESYLVGMYSFVSWGARQSISMDSFRMQEGTNSYVTIVGFGGIRKAKLLMTDTEWSNYVKANAKNGVLDYSI